MQTRSVTYTDLHEIQNITNVCFPDGYGFRYFLAQYLSSPELLLVADDPSSSNKVTGFVISSYEAESDGNVNGHISLVATHGSRRKMGLATSLIKQSMENVENFSSNVEYCSLHVSVNNMAAVQLYQNALGFFCVQVEHGYYAGNGVFPDGEDAFYMKKFLNGNEPQGCRINKDGTFGEKLRPIFRRNPTFSLISKSIEGPFYSEQEVQDAANIVCSLFKCQPWSEESLEFNSVDDYFL